MAEEWFTICISSRATGIVSFKSILTPLEEKETSRNPVRTGKLCVSLVAPNSSAALFKQPPSNFR